MRTGFFSIAPAIVPVLLFCCCEPSYTPLTEPTGIVHLYPEGQHSDKGIEGITEGPCEANGIDTTEFYWEADGSLNEVSDSARILIYMPRKHRSTMVVMCPGGGYNELQLRNEGYYVARHLTGMGYPVAIACYRMPEGHGMIPLTDIRNIFRYCRYRSGDWGIEKIGIMGGSAGGHLAATASVMYVDKVTRPDFTVLLYPVISSRICGVHSGTFHHLCKDTAQCCMFNPERYIDSDTPPAILFHSVDDRTVKSEHSRLYYDTLRSCGVEAELHLYPSGGHGWGFTTIETGGRDKLGNYRGEFFEELYSFLERQ